MSPPDRVNGRAGDRAVRFCPQGSHLSCPKPSCLSVARPSHSRGQAVGEFQGDGVLPVSPCCLDKWAGVSLSFYQTPTQLSPPRPGFEPHTPPNTRALFQGARFPQGTQQPLPSWGTGCPLNTDTIPEGRLVLRAQTTPMQHELVTYLLLVLC